MKHCFATEAATNESCYLIGFLLDESRSGGVTVSLFAGPENTSKTHSHSVRLTL